MLYLFNFFILIFCTKSFSKGSCFSATIIFNKSYIFLKTNIKVIYKIIICLTIIAIIIYYFKKEQARKQLEQQESLAIKAIINIKNCKITILQEMFDNMKKDASTDETLLNNRKIFCIYGTYSNIQELIFYFEERINDFINSFIHPNNIFEKLHNIINIKNTIEYNEFPIFFNEFKDSVTMKNMKEIIDFILNIKLHRDLIDNIHNINNTQLEITNKKNSFYIFNKKEIEKALVFNTDPLSKMIKGNNYIINIQLYSKFMLFYMNRENFKTPNDLPSDFNMLLYGQAVDIAKIKEKIERLKTKINRIIAEGTRFIINKDLSGILKMQKDVSEAENRLEVLYDILYKKNFLYSFKQSHDSFYAALNSGVVIENGVIIETEKDILELYREECTKSFYPQLYNNFRNNTATEEKSNDYISSNNLNVYNKQISHTWFVYNRNSSRTIINVLKYSEIIAFYRNSRELLNYVPR